MPIKRHPFSQAPAGTVFAIAITPEKWGFVRFFNGLGMNVLPLVGNNPEMPKIDWKNPPFGWFMFSFAPNDDKTEAVKVGMIPFPDEDSECPPPCYYPPDIADKSYRIYEKGEVRDATKSEVQGMTQHVRVTPERLAEFLREKLKNGELRDLSC